MTRCLLQLDRSTTGWKFPVFFNNWKSLLKNPVIEGNGQYTYSKAPFSNNLSSWLWVSTLVGVLVTGVTFPLQPDSDVLVDRQSHSRSFHYWEKLARRDLTYGTSLFGGTWSSCGFLQGTKGFKSSSCWMSLSWSLCSLLNWSGNKESLMEFGQLGDLKGLLKGLIPDPLVPSSLQLSQGP